MSNFVFYDFETSSSNKYWGQIIQIGAVLTNDNEITLKTIKINNNKIYLIPANKNFEEKMFNIESKMSKFIVF